MDTRTYDLVVAFFVTDVSAAFPLALWVSVLQLSCDHSDSQSLYLSVCPRFVGLPPTTILTTNRDLLSFRLVLGC